MFTFELTDFKIIPYVRMTTKGKFIKRRARQYMQNQQQLAWLIRLMGKGKVEQWPVKLQGLLTGENLRTNSDLDNYLKAIQDALVKAQVLPDDSLKYVSKVEFEVQKGEKNLLFCSLIEK